MWMIKQEKRYYNVLQHFAEHVRECNEPFATLIPLYKCSYIFSQTTRDEEEKLLPKILTIEGSADETYEAPCFASSSDEFRRRFDIIIVYC